MKKILIFLVAMVIASSFVMASVPTPACGEIPEFTNIGVVLALIGAGAIAIKKRRK